MKINVNWLREYVDIDIGIKELSTNLTNQGVSVEGVTEVGDDHVLDLEITPNRPDLLSAFGIAREIKAMLHKDFKKNPFLIEYSEGNNHCKIKVVVEDASDCPRYTGCYIEGIKVSKSPDWMQRRLELAGIRPINSIVDITNYVLLEMGHPLHAFNADTLEGEKIIIRRAHKNETLTTLDGVTRELDSTYLVIADNKNPIALAGIMGGEDSEIKEDTNNIFIESAYFNPALVRKESKKLNISTESSYRFERKADIYSLVPALLRATEFVKKLSGGEIKGKITDIYRRKEPQSKNVYFTVDWLNEFMGFDIPEKEAVETLTSLDMEVKRGNPIEVKVDSFRRDIESKEDIAEEVVRMVGFDRIPTPEKIAFKNVALIPEQDLKISKIKDYFVSRGYSETVNISFVSEDDINMLNQDTGSIPIKNPITSDLTHMRPNLILGLLKTVKRNINVGIGDIRIFEVGNIFLKDASTKEIKEPTRISGILTGRVKERDWRGENRQFDYFDMKGHIEGLFAFLNIENIKFRNRADETIFIENGCDIFIEGEQIGSFGMLSRKAGGYFHLSGKICMFDLELTPLLAHFTFEHSFQELPRYPAVLRDLCIVVPDSVAHQQIKGVINKECKGLIEKIELFDTYGDNNISGGSRSLTYSLTFRSPTGTLKDEEVSETINSILNTLQRELGVKLRGKN
jgi:phenylalanyl-tRNA synthetase beta chain